MTTTLALAPTAVAFPPRSAPSARAHHSDVASGPVPLATRAATRGAIVATYGMLSTTPLITADPNSSSVAASRNCPPTASTARSPSHSMTPTFTSAPTMMNSPMKKTRVSHSTSSRNSSFDVRLTRIIRPAPRSATTDGSRCSTLCSTNATMTSASTASTRRSMARIGDRLPLVERHHIHGPVGVHHEGGPEQEPGQHEEHPDEDHGDGGHVDQEVVEGQAGAAADDDVRRVPDQRGGAADVAEASASAIRNGTRGAPRSGRRPTA